jgi:hypothetical protein
MSAKFPGRGAKGAGMQVGEPFNPFGLFNRIWTSDHQNPRLGEAPPDVDTGLVLVIALGRAIGGVDLKQGATTFEVTVADLSGLPPRIVKAAMKELARATCVVKSSGRGWTIRLAKNWELWRESNQ